MTDEELVEKWKNKSNFIPEDVDDEQALVLSKWLESRLAKLLRYRRKYSDNDFQKKLRETLSSYNKLKSEK